MPAATGSRALAFGLCAAGALVAGIGATLPWITVGLKADTEGVLDETFHGIDLVGGLIALVAAIAVLAMLFAMRLLAARARRALALGLMLAGLAIITVTLLVGLDPSARAEAEMARAAAKAGGMTIAEAEQLIATQPDFAVRSELGVGLWLSALGGVLVVAGSIANTAWARRPDGSIVEAEP